jgi:hypothetical protein
MDSSYSYILSAKVQQLFQFSNEFSKNIITFASKKDKHEEYRYSSRLCHTLGRTHQELPQAPPEDWPKDVISNF